MGTVSNGTNGGTVHLPPVTTPYSSTHYYKFSSLKEPTVVEVCNLGPTCPTALSLTVRGHIREYSLWTSHFAAHTPVLYAPCGIGPPFQHLVTHPYVILGTDGLSVCSDCARLLSIRSCDGTSITRAVPCDFHRTHPDLPFACRTRFVLANRRPGRLGRLRDIKDVIWNPETRMTFYYLSKDLELGPPLAVVTLQTTGPAAAVIATMVPNSNSDSDTESSTDESASTSSTDGSTISVPVSAIKPSPPARKPTVSFRHLSFLSVLRQVDPHAAHPRASYRHQFTCLHGAQPSYIIQGPGLQGLYYKRCDGAFVNALGEQLTVPSNVHSSADSSSNTIQPPKQERVTDCTNAAVSQPSINSTAIFDTSLAASPAEIAERAWRRIHTDAGPDAWREVKALKKRAQREERREVREAARMEKRAERERSRQQRREDEGNNEEHRTKLGRAVKEKVRAVGSKCLEKVAFWGA